MKCSSLPLRHLLYVALLSAWTDASDRLAPRRTSTLSETSMELEPFQLLFTADDDEEIVGMTFMDEATLLETTRTHMETLLGRKRNHHVEVSLYESIRSNMDELFRDGTKIAFTGSARYLPSEGDPDEVSPIDNTDMPDRNTVLSSEYLCFLGDNATVYVDLLHQAGWKSLIDVSLLTFSGEVIEYRDGDMMLEDETILSFKDEDDSNTTPETGGSSSVMGEMVPMTMYLMAVLIPFAVLLVLAALVVLFCLHHRVNWKRAPNEIHPVWISHRSDARENALKMEISRIVDDQTDGAQKDLSSEQTSELAIADGDIEA